MSYGPFDEAKSAGQSMAAIRPVTIRQETESHISHLEKELNKKKELLKLLQENPVIEQFINLSRS